MSMQSIVQDLLAWGLTQTEIGAKCGCTQGRISEIANGHAKSVSYSLGAALTDLHKKQSRKARAASPEPKAEQGS